MSKKRIQGEKLTRTFLKLLSAYKVLIRRHSAYPRTLIPPKEVEIGNSVRIVDGSTAK